MKRASLLAFGVVLLLSDNLSSPTQAGEFRGFIRDTIEYSPWSGEYNHGDWFRLSDNGQVIVGYARTDAPGIYQAFRWSLAGGVEWLPFPEPPVLQSSGCLAVAVSGDGSKVYFGCTCDDYFDSEPYSFEDGVFTELPHPSDSGIHWARVYDATPSGDVAVGWGANRLGLRWSGDTYAVLRGPDAGPCDMGNDDESQAVLVSDDGTTIAGYTGYFSSLGFIYDEYARLVVWCQSGFELVRLDMFGYECGDPARTKLNGISGDGSIVVGGHPIPAGDYPYQPVWWNATTGDGHVLPLLPGAGHTEGVAYCTNRDGSVIGGSAGDRAVIWNRVTGGAPTPVEVILQGAGLAPDIVGWKLTSVYQMSGDGKQFAGHGIAPSGQLWNWWADLRPSPPPNDLCANALDITPYHVPGFHIHTEMRTVTGSTTAAICDAPHSCVSTIEPTVNIWYKYTAPVDGYLYLDLCDTGLLLLSPFIAVHRGCPGTGTNEIICRNACPEVPGCNRPRVMPPSLFLTGGQTYYIQVGGSADETGHPIKLKHRFFPLNDDCDDAFHITDVPSITPGSTFRRGSDPSAVCNEQIPSAPGVWYTVMGWGTTMTASTCGLAGYDTKINVYCGGCGGMGCVASNDDACGGSRRFRRLTLPRLWGRSRLAQVEQFGGENGPEGGVRGVCGQES